MKKFNLIPNIKVNYSLFDIIKACFVRENFYYLSLLKKELCTLYNVNDVILTCSGRSALYHLLKSLPQSKVIVPAYTCSVVVDSSILANKRVYYANVNRNTLNVQQFKNIDSDTIVIATHQFGFPCEIRKFCEMCKKVGAVVVEDCAGAFCLDIEGQMAGTFGDYAIFSFNASKLINSPSAGGFLIANKEADMIALRDSISFKSCTFMYKAKKIVKSLAYCLDKSSYMHFWISKAVRHDAAKSHVSSANYQPNTNALCDYFFGFYNWQAYVVLKQLKRLPEILKNREELKESYSKHLNSLYKNEAFNRQASSIRFPIYLENREAFRNRLMKKGVEIGFGFEHFVCPDDYKDEIKFAREIAYLPYNSNFTEKEISYIIKVLNQEANEQGFNS